MIRNACLASIEDQRIDIVVPGESIAEDATFFGRSAADILHAPRGPEALKIRGWEIGLRVRRLQVGLIRS